MPTFRFLALTTSVPEQSTFSNRISSPQSLDPRHPFSNNYPYLDLDTSTSSLPLQCSDKSLLFNKRISTPTLPPVILFGGAASIVHGILDRKAKDVDILVGVEALAILDDAIINMWEGFHRDCDGTIKWDKCDPQQNKLFEVTVELVEIGGPFVPRVPEVVGFGEGYVATLAELVRLRASTLVERGDASDHIDFVLLLSLARQRKVKLP
jgi:hypothetical protein